MQDFYKLFNGQPCGDSFISDDKECKLGIGGGGKAKQNDSVGPQARGAAFARGMEEEMKLAKTLGIDIGIDDGPSTQDAILWIDAKKDPDVTYGFIRAVRNAGMNPKIKDVRPRFVKDVETAAKNLYKDISGDYSKSGEDFVKKWFEKNISHGEDGESIRLFSTSEIMDPFARLAKISYDKKGTGKGRLSSFVERLVSKYKK